MRLITLMTLLSACGESPMPTGLTIADSGPYSADEAESVGVDIAARLTAGGLDINEWLMRGSVEIYFTDQPVDCGDETSGGCNRSGLPRIIEIYAAYRIIGCTAYIHEMMHLILLDHTDSYWYAQTQESSLEFQVYDAICNERIRQGEQLDW